MKTFKEKHQELYDDIVSLFRDKVIDIGEKSEFGQYNVIKIEEEFQFNILDCFDYIKEITKDFFISNEGNYYNFSCIEFSDLINLADYVNTL